MASVKISVECPASVKNKQSDTRQALRGWWSGQQYWPVGATEAELDESVVAKMEDEVKHGRSVLKITRAKGKLDDILGGKVKK